MEETHYHKCPDCKEWHWSNRECLPEYMVSHSEYLGEDREPIRAMGFEEAAEKYAEEFDSYNDNEMAQGGTVTVEIERGGITKKFRLFGEFTTIYSAREVE